MAYAYDMQCSPQMNLGGARQYTRTPCPSVRFLADGGFENHILGQQSRQVHLPPRSSATRTIENVGAFCVCATEASSKHPLTPYAAPHKEAFTATVLSHACGSLVRDLLNGHFGCPPRTALLPDGLLPIVWFVFVFRARPSSLPGGSHGDSQSVSCNQAIRQFIRRVPHREV